MRVVPSARDLPSALAQARSEASTSFGDDTIYLERYLERPRHVEIQIVGDQQGSLVHLLERECSIQRRLQKLIEECPSCIMPDPDDPLRVRMGEAAKAVARAAGYHNAGTVEFLVSADRSFYFLEMNTRLQVEHPVTEMVTGVDLVKLQIAIAAGRALPFGQDEIVPRGWAMEFRITAEDPFRGFLPGAGRITFLRPAGGPGVRDDSGVFAGCEVTPHYDPLIAKLIVWAEDRTSCLARARRAVREYRIAGIPTTLPFHEHLLHDAGFVAGDIDVAYVDRHWNEVLEREAGFDTEDERARAAVVAAAAEAYRLRASGRGRGRGAEASPRSAWREAALRDQLGGPS